LLGVGVSLVAGAVPWTESASRWLIGEPQLGSLEEIWPSFLT
jgi:hypothetical protein